MKLRVEPVVSVNRDDFRKPDGTFDKQSDAAYSKAVAATIDALPPYRDHPEAAVRSPAVPVRATNFVRIRVLVKMPRELAPGRGGLIVRDSLGGEALQFRTTDAIPEWKEIVLYRRAPADGEVSVLLGLAGYGEAYFDNLRIDVLGDSAAPESPDNPRSRPDRPTTPARPARPLARVATASSLNRRLAPFRSDGPTPTRGTSTHPRSGNEPTRAVRAYVKLA